ncbi:hypothetical protein ACLB2K_063453 [Fragaria x ananassa]
MSHERQQQVDDNNSRWSKHLPDELIEMIVKRLTLVDSIRFAAVCSTWRSVSSQWFQRVTRLPWLLKSVEILDSKTTVNYSLYSVSEDTAYDLKFPSESASSDEILCTGSANGWLIMSECCDEPITCTNYLLNPMTGDRIKLPQVTGFFPHVSTASSDPRSPDCIVATKNGLGFIFCRPGSKDWSWTTAKPELGRMDSMKFHDDGKLYVSGRKYDAYDMVRRFSDYYHVLVVFVPVVGKDEEITWDKERVIKLAPREPWTGVESITEPWLEFAGPKVTLSSKGKLLLVWRRRYIHEPDPPHFPYHVVKMDDDGWPGWENSVDFHVVKKDKIWAAYDASEDELVLISHGYISVRKSNKSFTRPTIDERFFGHHCGKLSILCRETTEDGSLLDNITCGGWFSPNIAALPNNSRRF